MKIVEYNTLAEEEILKDVIEYYIGYNKNENNQ
jgi:hypothetical protein